MKAFLLGRSGQLDGCAVATSRMLWVAVEICATVLKMCLKLGMKNNLLGKNSKDGFLINWVSFNIYFMLAVKHHHVDNSRKNN
jgi:hypothetical protein